MNDNIFIDTNIWIYLYTRDKKAEFSKSLVNNNFENIIISTQVLAELFNVLTKKKLKSKEETQEIINEIIAHFNICVIDSEIIKKAMGISLKYGYSYYDSQILATALTYNCTNLYSEDMQHNQLIEGQLTIINPYKE